MSDTEPTSPDDLRQEIDATRADLADTVDALSAKLDVKAQAKAKADEVKTTMSDAAAKAKASTPPPVQRSIERAGSIIKPAAAKAEPYRVQILAGAASVLVIVLLLRRRVRRSA